MFLETPASFMADFGSPVLYRSQERTQGTMAIFDRPDTDILSNRVQSTGYRIEYPKDDLIGLSRGDTVLVGIGPGWSLDTTRTRLVYSGCDPDCSESTQFRVLSSPNKIDDGVFMEALLEAV
jgi:hypothetical protein